MKDTKQKADELVEQFREYVWIDYRHDEEPSYSCMVYCAILSTKNTIEVLRSVKSNMEYTEHIKPLVNEINEQTEILKELEGRL